MSMNIVLRIICDGCGATLTDGCGVLTEDDAVTFIQELELKATHQGWVFLPIPSPPMHLCPPCAKVKMAAL